MLGWVGSCILFTAHLMAGSFLYDFSASMRSGPYSLKYIPEFTAAEKELIGTAPSALTAIGLNHYSTVMVDVAGNTSSVWENEDVRQQGSLVVFLRGKGHPHC